MPDRRTQLRPRERRCPRCNEAWGDEPGATSRADDETTICPACGVEEALRDARRLPRIPRAEWPVSSAHTRATARLDAFDGVRTEYLAMVERVGRTLGPDDDWMPVLMIEGRSGRTVVGLTDLLSSDTPKAFAANVLMPRLIREAGGTMFGLVTTAWVVTGSDLPVPPSEHPDRVESVVLSVADRTRYEVWVAPIRRSEHGSPRLVEWSESDAVDGLLVEPLRRAVCQQG